MTYNVRPVSPDDIPALTDFLDSVFHIRNKNKQALVLWKYFHGRMKGKVEHAAFDGPLMVAHYANIPCPVLAGRHTMEAMLCVDMATRKDYRGKGLISQLSRGVYEAVEKTPCVLSLGFSNSMGVKVDQNATGYGYRVVGKFISYGMVAIAAGHSPCELVRVSELDARTGYGVPEGYLSIRKDTSYMTWRYIDNHNGLYMPYAVMRQGICIGYVILRNNRVRMDVVDIALSDMGEHEVKDALFAIQRESIRLGKHFVIISVLDNGYWQRIFSGLATYKKPTHPGYYLTVRVHREVPETASVTDSNRWICLGGDIL
jgi:GNAT superfamily N-acetyltransferase